MHIDNYNGQKTSLVKKGHRALLKVAFALIPHMSSVSGCIGDIYMQISAKSSSV